MPQKISRNAAAKLGRQYYFTGKPCKRGHVTKRYTGNSNCRECSVLAGKLWRKKNPEKAIALVREWVKKNRGRCAEIAANWRKKNRSRYLAVSRKSYKKHREKHIKNIQVWRLKNPQKVAQLQRKARKLKKEASGRFSEADITRLFFKQGGNCAGLGCKRSILGGYTVDHKTPLSRGGSNWPKNLQLLCKSCNPSKGNRTMREWLRHFKTMERDLCSR